MSPLRKSPKRAESSYSKYCCAEDWLHELLRRHGRDLLWTNTLTGLNGAPANPYDDYGIQNIVDSTTAQIIYNGLGGDI